MKEQDEIYKSSITEYETPDYAYRPKSLLDFSGQSKAVQNLGVYISAAKKRKEPLDHVIFSGPPGLGKTTLANIISNELEVEFHQTSAPALDKKGDLVALLTKLGEGDVFFIDEIHRLKVELEEILYSAMEDYSVNIIIGQGISANSISIKLPKFTLVGATTRAGLLTRPLLSRFGIDLKLDLYSEKEIVKVIERTSKMMKIEVTKGAAIEISKRSRGTPRIANRLIRRLRDFAEVHGKGIIDPDIAKLSFSELGIDENGLTIIDKKLLAYIVENCAGGPVGLETISVSIGETSETVEDVIEPYLIQKGFIVRTQRGRCATKKAYSLLGKSPSEIQKDLF